MPTPIADLLRQQIRDLDVTATLARAGQAVEDRRAVELADALVVLHYADLHSADPCDDADRGGERLATVAGDGTPGVQELALCELAVARETHQLSVRSLVADLLDLRHRLGGFFEQLLALRCDLWLARKVASMTRHLTAQGAALVDAAVSRAIAGQAPSRVLRLTEAKIIEADPTEHAAKVDAARRRRYVGLSRTDEHGLREVIARVEAGEAAWIDATVDRVADILAAARPPSDSDDEPEATRDELRAEAFGWLARPAELLTLLLEHQQASDTGADDDPAAEVSRATAFPADLLEALGRVDLDRLRPTVMIHVHLHEEALQPVGVARCEELGPMTGAQVARLVEHARILVRPVLDLADRISVNAYEHPTRIADRIHLARPGDQFPHASSMSRHLDLDHPKSYDPDGPPDQTNSHDGQPLGRTGHRAKTHLSYTCDLTPTGEVIWRTPHGLCRVVGSRGTHPIDAGLAHDWLHPDDELDRAITRLYFQCITGQPDAP